MPSQIGLARVLSILSIVIFPLVIEAQIVNIESRRMRTDSVRISGFAQLGLSLIKNDDLSLFQFSGDAAVQWKSKDLKTEILFLSSYKTSRSRQVDYVDVLFGHLRLTRELSPFFRWELFQQYQKNPPLGISSRILTGTGPRIKFLNTDRFSGYFGTHYMYETEIQQESGRMLRHHRSSSYMSFTIQFPSLKSELVTTTYYQPEWGNASDFRVFSESQLLLTLTQNLVWRTDLQIFFDRAPPEGIRRKAMSLIQGIKYQF